MLGEDGHFNTSLRDYGMRYAPCTEARSGFVAPCAGRNHHFFKPTNDPYIDCKSVAHYDMLMGEADRRVQKSGGGDSVAGESEASSRRRSRASRRSRSVSPMKTMKQNAGRTPWNGDVRPKPRLRVGHVDKPRFSTTREMQAYRAARMLPDPSYDVDGDGAVSAQDCLLASKFDVNNDGKLDDEERRALRKTMCKALVTNYEHVPKVKGGQTAQMLKAFTKDLDKTVAAPDFSKKFNELYNKTALTVTYESQQMAGCLKPFEDELGQSRSLVGRKGGRMPTHRSQLPDTARSNDTIDLVRGPEWRSGGTRMKWAGSNSRQTMLKHRKEERRRYTEGKMDRRVKEHIVKRNQDGADLRMPCSWGDIATNTVHPRYASLDTNHDGKLSRDEFYSQASKETSFT